MGETSRFWVGMAAALVLGGVLGAAITAPDSSPDGQASQAVAGESSVASVCPATEVATKALPSVVTIAASDGRGGGTGSGEVIRADGYILTNNHVIAAAAAGGDVSVLFSDGRSVPAVITGRDPKTDLAVIKVDSGQPLPVIALGSSKKVVVGQPVVVLGAPLGLSNTVTAGIVSALDRTIEVPGENNEKALLVAAVQTDAAINPGNSGGAMVNCAAELIGIPTAGASVPDGGGGSIGLGFAIPVDSAMAIAEEIITTGRVEHAYLGVSVAAAPAAGGLYIRSVTPGGPAARAGLQPGDILTTIDGAPTATGDDVAAVTLTKNPGDTVTAGFTRAGRAGTTKVTLTAAP